MTTDIIIEVRLKAMGTRGANVDHLALLACEDIRSGLRFGKLPIEGVRVEVVTNSTERAIDQEWIKSYLDSMLAYAKKTNNMDTVSMVQEQVRVVSDLIAAWRRECRSNAC